MASLLRLVSQWVGLICLYVVTFKVSTLCGSLLLLSHVVYEYTDYLEHKQMIDKMRQLQLMQSLGEDDGIKSGNC